MYVVCLTRSTRCVDITSDRLPSPCPCGCLYRHIVRVLPNEPSQYVRGCDIGHVEELLR